jgi:hypothetical protein
VFLHKKGDQPQAEPNVLHNTKLFVFVPAQCATKYKKSFVPAVFSAKGFVVVAVIEEPNNRPVDDASHSFLQVSSESVEGSSD